MEPGDECNAVLVPFFHESDIRSDKFKAVLKILGRESWEKLKKEQGASLDLLVLEVGIGADANFEEFEVKRDQYLEASHFQENEAQSTRIIWKGFTSEQLRAWQDCTKAKFARQNFPLFYDVVIKSETTLNFVLEWRPPPGVRGTVSDFSLQGGNMLSPFQNGDELLPNVHLEKLIIRDSFKELDLSFTLAGGYYVNVVLPARREGEDFHDNRNGTITDIRGKILWTLGSVSGHSIDHAKEYARQLLVAGIDNWRLPTIAELTNIYDPGSPAHYKTVPLITIDAGTVWSLDEDETAPATYQHVTYDFVHGATIATNHQGFTRGARASNHPRTLCVTSLRTH